MYWKPPAVDQLTPFGLTVDDVRPTGVEIWAENAAAVDVFTTMGTQWRVGVSGATGLDYGPLPFVLRTASVPRKDWPVILDDIRVLEQAALTEMHRD